MSETNLPAAIVSTRVTTGGIAGAEERLTVHADGTLRLLNQRFHQDETRRVPPTQLEPLRSSLASEEWQSIGGFFGIPVPDGFQIRVNGGGRETGLAEPSQPPVELPPILGRVLTLLNELWTASTPGDDHTSPPQFSQPDVFELEGGGIRVTYQAAPEARSLHYRDEHHDRRFSGDELATVKIAAGTVVSAVIEEASHGDYTLDVIIPYLYLDGHDRPSDVEVPAIQTTIISGFVPNMPPFRTGQQQKYNVVWLRGSARKATTARCGPTDRQAGMASITNADPSPHDRASGLLDAPPPKADTLPNRQDGQTADRGVRHERCVRAAAVRAGGHRHPRQLPGLRRRRHPRPGL